MNGERDAHRNKRNRRSEHEHVDRCEPGLPQRHSTDDCISLLGIRELVHENVLPEIPKGATDLCSLRVHSTALLRQGTRDRGDHAGHLQTKSAECRHHRYRNERTRDGILHRREAALVAQELQDLLLHHL